MDGLKEPAVPDDRLCEEEPLGVVHRRVGPADGFGRARRAGWYPCDSDAGRRMEAERGICDCLCGGLLQAARDVEDRGCVRRGRTHDEELVTAEPPDGVARSDGAAKCV